MIQLRSMSATLKDIAGCMKKHEACLQSISKKLEHGSSSSSSYSDPKLSKKVAKVVRVSSVILILNTLYGYSTHSLNFAVFIMHFVMKRKIFMATTLLTGWSVPSTHNM